ncbi:MAG: hypothetical protein QOD38_1313 [Acidimicrobiaceae bacterium]|jgi:hypothetical protein
MKRGFAIGSLVAAIVVMSAGVALAGVSDGNYRPSRQHCSGHADDANQPDRVQKGCQSATLNVNDGQRHEPFRIGTQQTADGESAGAPTTSGDPNGFDPTTGVRVYMGADDNLDNGEHDSSSKIGDGPSDGGAVVFNVSPSSLGVWLSALTSGNTQYVLTHPLPLVDAGFGSCADGLCESVQTQQRTAYQGDNPRTSRDAANYDGKQWDPETCGGPSDTEADCGPGGIKHWTKQEGTVYVEPGAQVYEDPNPEGSPIGPYPLVGVYAGTCGVVAGGGPIQAPASPVTNGAGQIVVATGC